MLKIKDWNKNIKNEDDVYEFASKYKLETEADSDYESCTHYWVGFKDGVQIDFENGNISGIENETLELLFDLFEAKLVEKVEEVSK